MNNPHLRGTLLAIAFLGLASCKFKLPDFPPIPTPTPVGTPVPEPTPSPTPAPTPEPTPTPTPPPVPTPQPTPEPSPSPTPEPPPCGVLPGQAPVKLVRAQGGCQAGWRKVAGQPWCVVDSACPTPAPRENQTCVYEDLTRVAWQSHIPYADRRCWNWAQLAAGALASGRVVDGYVCEADWPDDAGAAARGCTDAYGRRVLPAGGTWRVVPFLPEDPGWDARAICPPRSALPCPSPTPTPTPGPPPGPSPTPGPTPAQCPPARQGISSHLRPVGPNHWRVDSTSHFGKCGQPAACNADHDSCGGRACEPADSGPNALRLEITCPPGTVCKQAEDNAYFIDVQGARPAWIEVCLAPGNVSQAGDVLRLLSCACKRETY